MRFQKLNEAYPASLRVARLSNRICSDRFRGMYARVATERLAATEDPTGYLMQMNEVRSIYQPPNMPGLILHVRVLERLIARKLEKLNHHLINRV